ncbi:MAG: NTP transferase domain-containing protein [Pseudomonadota bacterium]
MLLAAGHSRRFGEADKLLADLHGRPLVAHAAQAMREARVSTLVAVVSSHEVATVLEDFDCVFVEGSEHKQSDSLKAGIAKARALAANRALVVLADMPRVSVDLLDEVAAHCGMSLASAATDGERRLPPACFPQPLFDDLLNTQGDRGASPILRQLPDTQLVHAPSEMLIDIDLEEDLVRLRNEA